VVLDVGIQVAGDQCAPCPLVDPVARYRHRLKHEELERRLAKTSQGNGATIE